MSGSPQIPKTAKGFYIYPRTYVIGIRCAITRVLPALTDWVRTLTPTTEFLHEWKPTLVREQTEEKNNLLLELQNVSLTAIRKQFVEHQKMKGKNWLIFREGYILWQGRGGKEDVKMLQPKSGDSSTTLAITPKLQTK